ncbi:MAG: TonB-dependent receptor [Cytophagales bacterium]|nr:MAG: TonB-dependent receptor [Cytophagales bacterium]
MRYFFTLLFVAFFSILHAQEKLPADSLKTLNLGEVVVTATRTEKLLAAVPMLVTIINQQQIKAMGSLRLNEVLQEQTGLVIQTNHGNGIQMQGMNPDYTLILIDGEPLIGRTAGTLELSRLAVGNIKQIEIVKGPSSSLYGSEALAGVVNIITENSKTTKATLSSRYGTNNTLDISGSLSLSKNKFGAYLFANRYSTGGYALLPQTFGQTVEPFHNYTLQGKFNYDFSEKVKFSLSTRYFIENQQSNFDIGEPQNPNFVSGNGQVKDMNFNPILHYKISDKWKTQFRFYNSVYETNSKLNYLVNKEVYDETFFRQTFLRPEIQTEYFLSEKHIFTLGAGKIWESVAATRYNGTQTFSTNYAFLQYEFQPVKKLNLIFGGRFDNHSAYGSQLSPKLSLQYDITPKIALRASTGVGFKAPDFRQLYLNFNNAVAGYSVFGTEELGAAIAQLQAQNQIAEILLDPSAIGKIKAEKSLAYNFGFKIKPIEKLLINLNFFRNDISNLIETQVFARKTNGQNVFSYRNLNEVFTQGVEIDASCRLDQNFTFFAGYQFLQAKDKNIIEQVNNGEIFKRDPQTLAVSRVSSKEYGGLFGRSPHTLNVKLFYENQQRGISANVRGIYRGKYGIGDRNGNLILDDDIEYVSGYFTWNMSVSKELLNKKLRLQTGIDNIFNQKDPQNIPNLAGRLLWVSVNFQISKN